MINRKTKRNSPPPAQMTIATMDTKLTYKWSRMLQLISPPNKIRRATTPLIGEHESDDEEEEDNDNEEDNTVEPKKRGLYPSNKQKLLHRRGMYISTPPLIAVPVVKKQQDGPKDARQKWSLYRATHQKLRRNSLSLREGLHLKKMFDIFQQDEAILQQESTNCFDMEFLPKKTAYQSPLVSLNKNLGVNHDDEEDNIPLGTLFEKTKPVLNNMNRHAAHKPRHTYKNDSHIRPQSPPPSISSQSINNIKQTSRPMSRSLAPPTPVHFIPSSNHHYRNAASSFLQPYYYYHSNHGHSPNYPVQFI